MDSDDLLIIAAVGIGAYVLYSQIKKGIFEPDGMTTEGLQNTALRQNATTYRNTYGEPSTYIKVGDTSFQVRDSELSQTGFIRRRAALGNFTGLDNFDWFNKWVYS